MTAQDVQFQCRCRAVTAVASGITPSAGNHCICYCHDCQAFAHLLGRSADVLDAHGGTDIFQMSPSALRFTAGADQLACVRLAPKGLLRWYARCCNTPVANTLPDAGMPFVGAIRAFARAPVDEQFGPIRGYAFRESASGDRATMPRGGLASALMVPQVLGRVLWWRLRGHHRKSPFFTAAGAPIVEPRVLSAAERGELQRALSSV